MSETRPDAARPPFRVAVVIPRYYPIFGGAENQARVLSRALRATGAVEIPFILTKRVLSAHPRQESIDGVLVRRIGIPGNQVWNWYVWYVHAAFFLLMRQREYDLIHCHATSVIGFLVALAAGLVRKPAILKISSNGELFKGTGVLVKQSWRRRVLNRLRSAMARQIGRRAVLVALNREGLDEARRTGTANALMIPNGIDKRDYQPLPADERRRLRAELGFRDEHRVLLFVGRFTAGKGLDVLLSAFEAARKFEPNLRLCIVGSGDLQAESVDPRGLTPSELVHVFPPRIPPADFYRAADLFVSPSRREGMPNVVLEALAAGLPCALSDIAPHRELQEENPEASIGLFRDGDAADLAREIRCDAEAPRRSERSTLADRFDIAAVALSYVNLYRAISSAAR